MKFQNPEFLLLLPIAVLLYFIFRRVARKRTSLLAFPLFKGIRSDGSRRWLAPVLLDILGFIMLAIAIARPVSLDRVVTPPVKGKDIVIALDVSTSMNALDFKPKDRLKAAKTVIEQFVAGRKSDRLGLVFFAQESFLQVPLTTDYSIFMNLLSRLETGVIADGTAIGNGIGLAVSRLENSKAKSRVIILLTDGDNNSGNLRPEDAAQLAKENGIKIYTILIGTNREVPYPTKDIWGGKTYTKVRMKVNPALMQKIAKTTGGKFYQSISTNDLKDAFIDIDKLEKSEIPTKKFKLYKEFAPSFIIFGIILILLARVVALLFPLYPEVER